MKVLNVVSVLSAREGGGNGERTVRLSRALCNKVASCGILTLKIGDPKGRISEIAPSKLYILNCISERFQIPLVYPPALNNIISRYDIISLVGHWSFLNIFVAYFARKKGIPYVVTPAGSLPIFGRSSLIKKLFNYFFGVAYIKNASGWIGITHSELASFSQYGIDISKVRIFPNGVEAIESSFEHSQLQPTKFKVRKNILFMGRLNRIKGPDLLLEAFISISEEFPHVQLVFAGPDEGLLNTLYNRAIAANVIHKVQFVGFLGGQEKQEAYRSALLLVVPSRLEAMSIVAVEAGVFKTPVLMTDQCGCPEVAEVSQKLLIDVSVNGIADGLRYALSDETRLRSYGESWKNIVFSRFLWSDIAHNFKNYLQTLKN